MCIHSDKYKAFSISARVSFRDPHISPRRSREIIAGLIWKRSCINLFIIYFRQIMKMKYINDFIWKSNCTFNRYICRALLWNNNISTPININDNISYEGILKHRKFGRCYSFLSFFIYRESWRVHCLWIVFIQYHFMFSVILI